jgi:hypothetical protein
MNIEPEIDGPVTLAEFAAVISGSLVWLGEAPAAILTPLHRNLQQVAAFGHHQVIPRLVVTGLDEHVKSATSELGSGNSLCSDSNRP